jgi:hypothetical protein
LLNARQEALLAEDGRCLRNAIGHVGAAIAGGGEPPALGLVVIHDVAARTFTAAFLTGVAVHHRIHARATASLARLPGPRSTCAVTNPSD